MADTAFDFEKAWKEVRAAERKALPRTVTNLLAQISTEAIAAKRWPDAAQALMRIEGVEESLRDARAEEWLPDYAARVDAAPAEIQGILQLHLAHVYKRQSESWRWGGRKPTKLSDGAATNLPPWSAERIDATLESVFQKVLARAEDLRTCRVEDWSVLVDKGHLPTSYRPTLFDVAVHDMLDFYGRTIPDKTLEKGCRLLDQRMAFHRTDATLDALADAELARIRYIHAFENVPSKEKDEKYAAALDAFLNVYDGKTEVVALAAYHRANALERAGERVAAHDLAENYAARWPKAVGGHACRSLVSQMEKPEFSVTTERTWSTPKTEIEVRSRNLSQIVFRIARVSFDDVRENDLLDNSFYRDNSKKICKNISTKLFGVRTWQVALDNPKDYEEHVAKFPIPTDLKPGHYVLLASMDKDFAKNDKVMRALSVTVTDLALAVVGDHGTLTGRVFRAESGRPAAGVTIEFWESGSRNSWKKTAEEKTREDGTFAFAKDRLYGFMRAVDGDHEVLSLGMLGSGITESPRPTNNEHVDLVTDRAVYRPGQEIKFKGVAYCINPEAKDAHVCKGRTVVIDFLDPNGKPVKGERHTTTAWGSFYGSVTVPIDRMVGSYELKARLVPENYKLPAAQTTCRLNVEEYKRPKFTVELNCGESNVHLGSPTRVTGVAKTHSGLPVQQARVKWRVKRSTDYPSWWSWFGTTRGDDDNELVASGEATTDASGAFEWTFTPQPSATANLDGEPVFSFDLTAEVVDGTGETRVAARTFRVGMVAWKADVWASSPWLTASAPVTATVAVATHDGVPVATKGTLKIYALIAPPQVVRASLPRNGSGSSTSAWKGADAETPWDWKTWKQGACVQAVDLETDAKGRAATPLSLPAGAYRLAFSSQDPQGKSFRTLANICVFDTTGSAPLCVPDFFKIEKTHVPVGETIRFFWSSGYATGTCRIRATHNGKALFDEQTDMSKPFRFVEIPVRDDHRGAIIVTTEFLRENRLYRQRECVNVPWDNKYLSVKAEHLTSRLEPGTKETWTFRVTSKLTGDAALAEVLAFMYDKSLDAFRRHNARLVNSIYFDSRERYIATPSLQNNFVDMYHLCGHFPSTHYMPILKWPSFKALESYRNRFGGGAILDGAAAGGARMLMRSAPMPEANVEIAASIPAAAEAPVAEEEVEARPEPDVPLRRNLQETAFFLPNLETDADGKVSFTFTAPDALTGWKLFVLAHDKDLASGHLEDAEIVTQKSLMVEPNAPRFAREGDVFHFAVKVTNTSETPQRGEVSLAFEDVETGAPATVGGGTQAFDLKPSETRTFEFEVTIPDGQGFLKYVAKAKGGTFADGEEGWLPVLSRRILVQEAVQLQARGAVTRTFALSNLLASASSDTLRHQDLTVDVVSRPAWYAVLSLPYLMEFPHECNEQTFSRYYANALGAYIANSDSRIRAMFDAWTAAGAEALKSPLETNERLKTIALDSTPWVREARHETAARARIGAFFEKGRLDAEQSRARAKLRLNLAGGMWPWFPGGHPSEGVTLYILTGFARLNRIAGVAWPDYFNSVCETLDKKVEEDIADRRKKKNLPFVLSGFDIHWLYLHSFANVPAPDKKTSAFLLDELEKAWTRLGLAAQADAAIVLQRAGRSATARDIMASLKERAIVSDEMGMYWKRSSFFSSSLFAAPVSTQAAIVEAFLEVAKDAESVDACRTWMLKQKQTQNWSSTVTTADAIYALLLDGGSDLLAGGALATVKLGSVEVPKEKVEEGTGRYSYRVKPADVKPEMGNISFTADGKGGVAWGGVHWSYFEDVLKVRAHEPKELRVEKKYFKKVHTPQGVRLEAANGVVEQGDELVARLVLVSDRVYEYVHLKDERPSCCEPVDVLSSYRWHDGVGFYQATRDTATHYYIDRLGKGKFVLETSFRVQQRGVFSGGLATLQCMYAPEFTAHSAAEKIEVK